MENRDKLPAPISTQSLIIDNGDYYLSVYAGEPASDQDLKVALHKLSAAFPQLDKEFLGLLASEIRDAGITTQRLHDAITYTVRNVHFPKIADIMSYDKKIRLYKYHEIVELVTSNKRLMSDFEIYNKEKKLWIDKSDKIM